MQHCCYKIQNLLRAATIATTMEVVVDELWTSTVARMPIIRPATGLLRISFEAKASPAAFPPNKRKALLRKSNEQMNKYRRPRSKTILVNAKATRRNFPLQSSSIGQGTERFDHTIISPMVDPKMFLETAPHHRSPQTPLSQLRSRSSTEVAIAAKALLLATGFKAFVNPVVIWCGVIIWHCYIGIDKKTLDSFALRASCCSLYVTCFASWNEFLAKW